MCGNKNQLSDFYMYESEYNPQPTGLTKWEMQKLLGEAATMSMDIGHMLGTADTSETSEDEEESDNEKTCKICFEKKINTAVVPCGHACMCIGCSKSVMEKNAKCPICTNNITQILKLFNA